MSASKNANNSRDITIKDLLEWTGGTVVSHGESVFTGIFTDSRRVVPGGVFVALCGENFNGHRFVEPAFKAGAAAAIVSEPLAAVTGKTLIQVPDTLAALGNIAGGYRERFTLPIVAITGSVGKTTTKDVLSWCLAGRYKTLKTEANHNNDIGVPETLLKLDGTYEAAVVEMGMRGLGEIERLCRITRPDAALITNVEPVHLELLGSMENIAKAKCEIFSHLQPGGWGMISGDHPLLVAEAKRTGRKFYTFGQSEGCDCRLEKVALRPEGMALTVRLFDWQGTFTFAIPSESIALDVLAASGMAYRLGLEPEEIAAAVASYEGDTQRLHTEQLPEGGLILNDTYNANPLSMAAALDVLCAKAGHLRRVAVLGDMYELGAMEREGHLTVGQKAASCGVDVLVAVGELGRMIAEGAAAAGMPVEQIQTFDGRSEALAWLKANVSRRDAVLFKASHGLRLEELLEQWKDGEEATHEF